MHMSSSPAPAASIATRENYKGHARPERVWFFGTHTKHPAEQGILVNVINDNGPKMTDVTTGKLVRYLSPAGKFWAVPA